LIDATFGTVHVELYKNLEPEIPLGRISMTKIECISIDGLADKYLEQNEGNIGSDLLGNYLGRLAPMAAGK
jgi:hypothetical protein